FSLPLAEGEIRTALREPNSLVISRSMAETYFGTEEAIGKVLKIGDWEKPQTVTAVMEDIPLNSHFHFDILASMTGMPEAQSTSWMESGFFTYLVLAPGADYKQLEAKLPQDIDKYIGPQMQEAMGVTLAEFRNQGSDLGFNLQRLTDIHFHSVSEGDLEPGGNLQYVYIFSAIALFILLIACINFMNLSTAGATRRAREVGIRKVMGSAQSSLIGQFMTESLMITAFSLLLAVGMVVLALPFFNTLTGISLRINVLENPWLLPGLLAVGLVTGLLAGSYPAFFLSSFKPIAVLKGKFKIEDRRSGLRGALVVFQFFVSILLIISTLIVYGQLTFIQHKELGYQKEQVIVLPDIAALGNRSSVFRDQLAQDPRVLQLSISGYLPVGESFGNNFFLAPDHNAGQVVKTLRYDVDEHYLQTLGMKLKAGRNFSPEFGTDSSAVILNETAAAALGFGDDASGRTVIHQNKQGVQERFQVIGVVKDFHFRSLHEAISPLVMRFQGNAGSVIVKANPADMAGLLASARQYWSQLAGDEPFTYSFLDERFEKAYQNEQRTGLILGIFAGLTIFVACLGLLGLVTFSIGQRNKEIGVRKVLGATVTSIVALLSAEFLKRVLLALVLASPAAYWAMSQWLADFAYRIDIPWWAFALAGGAALLLAFATISFQSIRAAIANPVNSLRSESIDARC
ncbi:MAG: FtsX-like permease family protein, partial [Bacteroidetes bacterium]